MPRSALRHRPIASDADGQSMTGITPVAQRASLLRPRNTEEDEEAASGKTSAAPRAMRAGSRRRISLRAHPLLLLGIGMILMLVLWTLLTLAVRWVSITWDDLHYGRPRTFQIDAVVGQDDSPSNPSHFIAVKWD